MMSSRNISLISVLFLCCACAPQSSLKGQLGYNEQRRVVIVGENIEPAIAKYYERKYDCPVWFTPFEGKVANAANNFLRSGLGASPAMQALIGELKSINGTFGRWEILVPKTGEKYFFNTLKHMETSSLGQARGLVVLLDSAGFPRLEEEVKRVSDGNFFVTYELHKDLSAGG